MFRYVCSAVVNGSYCETTVEAVSDKQAEYLFSRKYGFNKYDFRVLRKQRIGTQYQQLRLEL